MKKTAIGHVDCPVCGFAHAEVKEDKNTHAYIHCTDCNAQTFTRNEFRNAQLRKRMRPVTVSVTVTEPSPADTAPAQPATDSPATPQAAPKKKPTPTPAPAPQIPPAPVLAPPVPKKTSWFNPLLGN